MYEPLPLSIGILSWGQHNTLRNTLESYAENGLLYKAAQVFIFFQEMSDEDVLISEEYGLWYDGAKHNLGIAGGYRAMLELVDQPFYLFLENDWWHRGYQRETQIEEGIELLSSGIDVARYRSKQEPGNPLWTLQFQGRELSRPEHLLDSIHWIDDPSEVFPQYIDKRLVDGNAWYYTTAKNANWTNNPHMVRTDWARTVLGTRLGERDIERDLQEWWQTQDYLVAQSDGLFTHWRIG